MILGLGSNEGDRLAHLRLALDQLKNNSNFHIRQISPLYLSDALLPENAPASWNMAYLNLAISLDTTLSPDELLPLLKKIENHIGRKPKDRWAPRIIDIDILAWDDLVKYEANLHIPHESLHERPFALWPLADLAPYWLYPLPGNHQGKTAAELTEKWGSRFTATAPFHTRQIAQRIDTPQLVGIINVTPDSFSDGGLYLTPDHAMQQIKELVNSGAEIIDIGAEATNPTAALIDAETEWQRLYPILSQLSSTLSELPIKPKISLDTRHSSTVKQAFNFAIDWINDVSGLEDNEMREMVAWKKCDVVIMHHLTIPANKQHVLPINCNVVKVVYEWAIRKISQLTNSGIALEKIIFDIGIGFGKTAEQSLQLIQQIKHFHSLNTRLLVGHSRKRFLSLFTDKTYAERDLETEIISLFLANQHIDYLRVHNVDHHARVFKVAKAFATV